VTKLITAQVAAGARSAVEIAGAVAVADAAVAADIMVAVDAAVAMVVTVAAAAVTNNKPTEAFRSRDLTSRLFLFLVKSAQVFCSELGNYAVNDE
jgi:hypothetical protein